MSEKWHKNVLDGICFVSLNLFREREKGISDVPHVSFPAIK